MVFGKAIATWSPPLSPEASAFFPPSASLFALSLIHTSHTFSSSSPSSVKLFLSFTLYMERGGFHGYHHKLPRMISSSDMTQQGQLASDHMMNGKTMPSVDHHHMMSHATANGRMMPHDHQMLNLNPNNNNHKTNAEDPNECTVREQDRFMPIANVIRIMRKMLPCHAKISDDAKETIQECVSEFISFITGEANERCQREQSKTITAEDVLWAMSKLGFDDYVDPLTLYLHHYREIEGDRGSIRGEPLVKRAYDYSSSSPIQAFPPAFHLAAHHPPSAGYYGPMGPVPPPCNGCGGGGDGGSGQPGFEPYGQQNKG